MIDCEKCIHYPICEKASDEVERCVHHLEEPKQGKWIDTYVQYQDNGDVERRCSVCGYGDRQSPSAIVPYCWHCGARMKEGEQK